jgi:hypothetical protein
MVLAILTESDLALPDDVVESMIDKVWYTWQFYLFLFFLTYHTIWISICGQIHLDNDGGRFKRRWKDWSRRVEGICSKESISNKEHESSIFKVGHTVLFTSSSIV